MIYAKNVFSLLLTTLVAVTPFSTFAKASKQAVDISQKYLLVDTHIDVPYRLENRYDDVSNATIHGEFDYPRAVAGGLDAPFMSIYIPATMEETGGGKDLANRLIDRVEAIVGRAPDKFALAYSVEELVRNFKAGKISLPMGMENGTALENDLDNLAFFYQRGIRYITLTHSMSNHISDSSYSSKKPWKGLSPFGKELITAMNNIGMMIDVSHVSDQAFKQVIALSKAPVIASHSSLRHFTPGFERNLSDQMLTSLKDNGGVIQINFGSAFLTQKANQYNDSLQIARNDFMKNKGLTKRSHPDVKAFDTSYRKRNPYPYASVNDVVDHIDRAVKLMGIEHVGIGSDYDGVGDSLPNELKDVSSFPNLIQELLNRNYSESDIEKLMGGNLIRVWRQVEQFALDNA